MENIIPFIGLTGILIMAGGVIAAAFMYLPLVLAVILAGAVLVFLAILFSDMA